MSQQAHAYWRDQTLILQVYLQPRASRDEVIGWHERGLKIRLKAPPVDGKANQQLIRFLAQLFRVNQTDVQLLKGDSNRQKTLSIHSPKNLPDWLSSIET